MPSADLLEFLVFHGPTFSFFPCCHACEADAEERKRLSPHKLLRIAWSAWQPGHLTSESSAVAVAVAGPEEPVAVAVADALLPPSYLPSKGTQ